MEQQAGGFLSVIHNSELGRQFKVVVIGHKVIEWGLWILCNLFYFMGFMDLILLCTFIL